MGRLSRISRALGKVAKQRSLSPRGRALATLIAGGATTSVGVAMIYLPAGVILAGLQLTALALLLINVPKAGR